jgi:hypothetical protein
MRKAILTLLAVLGLIVGGSTAAFAAAPVHTRSTDVGFYSVTQNCRPDAPTCRVDVFPDGEGGYVACVFIGDGTTFVPIIDGCDSLGADELTITDTSASLSATIPLYEYATGVTTPTLVVAEDHATGGKVTHAHGHSGYKNPDCAFHDGDHSVDMPIAGTLTIGDQSYPETGGIVTDVYRSILKGDPAVCFF